jgi:hypothetical protein
MVEAGSGATPTQPAGHQSTAAARPPENLIDVLTGSGPSDAATAFYEAATAQVKRSELGRPDPLVSVAFTLGWQMSEVYRPERRATLAPPVSEHDLPGISRLTEVELEQMGLDQVQAGITKLAGRIINAGLELPDAEQFGDSLTEASDPVARQQTIRGFHVRLLSTLTAADFRLGQAYGLGRALADTTRDPPDYVTELGRARIATLTGWVRVLGSALPDHAAHSVADSMEAWSRYVSGAGRNDTDTQAKLRAQGELWRSLLSGEKQPTAMLETSDYLHAGEGLLQRTAALAGSFLKHYWWLVALVVILFVGGIVVIAVSASATAVVAGAGSVLASLGISWKGIGNSLGGATARLEQPLWQAQLDQAVYERITPQTIVDSQAAVRRGPDEPSLDAPRPTTSPLSSPTPTTTPLTPGGPHE